MICSLLFFYGVGHTMCAVFFSNIQRYFWRNDLTLFFCEAKVSFRSSRPNVLKCSSPTIKLGKILKQILSIVKFIDNVLLHSLFISHYLYSITNKESVNEPFQISYPVISPLRQNSDSSSVKITSRGIHSRWHP